MFEVKEIFDLRGSMEKVGTFDDMDDVNEFIVGKHGFYVIESLTSFVTVLADSVGKSYEIVKFGNK